MSLKKLRRRAVLGLPLCGLLADAGPVSAELREQGSKAPDFTLRTIDGTPVTLSGLRGKPVVLEFWASWCGPCRRQFPKMAEIHKKYQNPAVALLH